MSVYQKKGSPFWYYDFQVGGERFSGSTGKKDEGKAQEHADRLKKQRRAELDARNALLRVTGRTSVKKREPIKVGAAMDRYFNEVVSGKPCEVETETQLARLASHFGQETWLHDVDSDKVAAFATWRKGQTARRKKTKVTPATVNRDLELLRRVINRARKTWKRETGDDIDWREILLEEPEGRVRELAATEETSLTRIITTMRPELLPPFLFSIFTGLRQAAVVNLTWHQVDFSEAVVRVRLKSRKPGGRILSVPLSAPALALLTQQKGKHATAVFTYTCRKKRGDRLVESIQPITASWLGNLWRAALKDAEVTDFRWHDLRHTAATRTLRVSNLAVVKELLGHRDISSTVRYAHADVEDVRRAVTAAGLTFEAKSHQSPTSDVTETANMLKKKA